MTESQSEQMRRVNSEEVEVVVAEYVEGWADGLEKLEEDYAMLQKSLCGTNAELSKAWDRVEQRQSEVDSLCIYAKKLEDDLEGARALAHSYITAYENLIEKLQAEHLAQKEDDWWIGVGMIP